MKLELKKENGSLNAYCSECGVLLETTTAKLRELAVSGAFESVDVICENCSSRLNVSLQLGFKEYGVKE